MKAETVTLDKENEYRFEVPFDSVVTITVCVCLPRVAQGVRHQRRTTDRWQLLSGTAEIFGTELAAKKPYVFSGCKVCAWAICTSPVPISLMRNLIAARALYLAWVYD